ncbi:MAG: hypothetical protein WB588_01370 [Dehalococcoidia bacterium]
MDIDAVYVRELRAILACDQSDGYLKKWTSDQLDKIERQASLVTDLGKVPVLTA